MTQQAAPGGGRSDDNVPVRSLIACRLDSTSTVSTLSFGSGHFGDDNPPQPGRTSSIARIDRFRSSTGTDRCLKAPGRKGSLHNVISPTNSGSSEPGASHLPPRCPNRQVTADRELLARALDDDGDRPGLNRISGGINIFSKS